MIQNRSYIAQALHLTVKIAAQKVQDMPYCQAVRGRGHIAHTDVLLVASGARLPVSNGYVHGVDMK